MTDDPRSPINNVSALMQWYDHIINKQDPEIEDTDTAKKPRKRSKSKTSALAEKVEYQHVDKCTQSRDNRHNQGSIDSPVLARRETKDGPSLASAEREGLDMKGVRTDARLLFETVTAFRVIRDCHRLGRLARALSLNIPSHNEPTIHEVEELVNRLGGKSFGSFEANHMAAQEIQGLLNDLELRVACPKAKCGQPASLYHRSGGRARNGVFVFAHAGTHGANYHGGLGELPEMRLMRVVSTSRKVER